MKNKNIHLIPTEKPSRLGYHKDIIKEGRLDYAPNYGISEFNKEINYKHNPQNIYITNLEELKEGDWFTDNNNLLKRSYKLSHVQFANPKKIILTTDQDLIADGVQEISEEFLQWFIKNPSCEKVDFELENLDKVPYGNEYINLSKINSSVIKSNFLPNNSKKPNPPKLVRCTKTDLIFETKYRNNLYPGYYDCIIYKPKYKIIIPSEDLKFRTVNVESATDVNWKSDIINKIWDEDEEPKQDWFCPNCDSYVSSESVTFEETHEICNRRVILLEPKHIPYTGKVWEPTEKEEEKINEAAEKYGKQVLSDRKDKNLTLDEEIWLSGGSIIGFIDGAKSYEAKDYWFKIFKSEQNGY